MGSSPRLSSLPSAPGPDAWDERPALFYGFDDLTLVQRELIAELSRTSEVTVAVSYADRVALNARAGLVSELREDLGASEEAPLEHDPSYTSSRILAHLDRELFGADAGPVDPTTDWSSSSLPACAAKPGDRDRGRRG